MASCRIPKSNTARNSDAENLDPDRGTRTLWTMQDKRFNLSVKAIVLDDQQRCLVIRRSSISKNNAGLWDLPGGKTDPGEELQTALLREVHEETNLKVRLTRVLGTAQSEMADRVVVYLLFEAQPSDSRVQLSEEHDDYKWQPRCELTELAWPAQFQDFISTYAAGGKSETNP